MKDDCADVSTCGWNEQVSEGRGRSRAVEKQRRGCGFRAGALVYQSQAYRKQQVISVRDVERFLAAPKDAEQINAMVG